VSEPQEPDRRLHPLSILFGIAQSLRDLLVPIGVALFASRSQRMLLIGAVIVAGFTIISAVWNWLTYRFRYEEHDLVIRSGKFFRNERHIPYNRIQNIDAVQNVAHRLFGVAIVQVQTGSGREPEATIKVLALSTLDDMRKRVFAERATTVSESAAAEVGIADAGDSLELTPHAATPIRLLHLPPRELLLAGLIENRGMALIVATIAALSRFDPLEEYVVQRIEQWIPEWAKVSAEADLAGHISGVLLATTVALLGILLFVRALSTLWAFIRLYDFTLVRDGDDLRAEYGMFTRITSTIPVGRVQTISLHQRLLHRRTGRAAIRVTTAGGGGMSEAGTRSREREWLAPIIRVEDIEPLLRHIDDSISFSGIDWQTAHRGAVWRLFRVSTAWGAVITAAAAPFIGWWAIAIAIALLVRASVRSRVIVRNLGASMVDGRAFFRSGWLDRITTVVRFERIQSANFRQSFFDRRAGMATVSVDSAGAGTNALQMPYLPRDEALVFHERIARAAKAMPFTW
jgi:putative membrane protein